MRLRLVWLNPVLTHLQLPVDDNCGTMADLKPLIKCVLAITVNFKIIIYIRGNL